MIARETCWKAVQVGSYVEDQNGGIWKVEDFRYDDDSVRLLNREGKAGKIPWPADDKPVTIWEPSMKDATELITKILNAVELSPQCPK